MLFTSEYSMKMPIGEALAVSFIGIATVMIILAVIACLIIVVSRVIRAFEKKASKNPEEVQMPAAVSAAPSQSSVELINTDEKTAAVIMAIVSKKTGIPLNRLQFRSIRYTGESGKGDEEK